MRRLITSTRPCTCEPMKYFVGFEVSRQKVATPIYDKNGKVVRTIEKDVVVKKLHDVTNNPNDGLVYTDFDVEALQRLGVSLSQVNPAFVDSELCEVDSTLQYVSKLEKQFFNDSNNEN